MTQKKYRAKMARALRALARRIGLKPTLPESVTALKTAVTGNGPQLVALGATTGPAFAMDPICRQHPHDGYRVQGPAGSFFVDCCGDVAESTFIGPRCTSYTCEGTEYPGGEEKRWDE